MLGLDRKSEVIMSDFELYDPHQQFDLVLCIGCLDNIGHNRNTFRKLIEFTTHEGTIGVGHFDPLIGCTQISMLLGEVFSINMSAFDLQTSLDEGECKTTCSGLYEIDKQDPNDFSWNEIRSALLNTMGGKLKPDEIVVLNNSLQARFGINDPLQVNS